MPSRLSLALALAPSLVLVLASLSAGAEPTPSGRLVLPIVPRPAPVEPSAGPPAREDQRLQIDPLLLAQADLVWQLIARDDNAIWPGWNAKDTPILFYLPGEQDVLLNHPSPPEGFVEYEGFGSHLAESMHVRSGETLIDSDGQNTSRDVNGVETLVVADTLSNRRQSLWGVLSDPRSPAEVLRDLPFRQLRADPYWQITVIAHEAFHVYQTRAGSHRFPDERGGRVYPCLDAENNLGVALEGDALAEVLRSPDAERARNAALRWWALRRHRRATMAPEAVAYEDGNEFLEGLATYVEWRMLHELETAEVDDALFWAQGFHGTADLSQERERMIRQMVHSLDGTIVVNNDRYGLASVRRRLYFSGMGIAGLLDRLAPGWHPRIFEAGQTLSMLAEEALAASPDELERARQDALSSPRARTLRAEKEELEREGLRDTEERVAAILQGEHTGVHVDHSAVADEPLSMAYTPFGLRAVDEHRSIYTMVPLRVSFGKKGGFAQTINLPLLEDREHHRMHFRLPQTLSEEQFRAGLKSSRVVDGVHEDLELSLPSVRIFAPRARAAFVEGEIRVEVLR